ncbi:hypothetical protein GCM10011360_17430 [Primorskyibacter flagellatus]|uniref:Uncharacterized protein n=1 Tax=Primorskyibacter flagellatus TaxID=1387277 RepID=A0A917EE08_9RHOB|nr:hypothetical protein [Primorskyibacter flagellatus]GGE29884.1 hypothetical protein GCM10011360_17430 [Primorskyibacter flagellatus]
MSFFNCMETAMGGGEADRERGERAQRMWRDMSDRYERQGYGRHDAESMAAEDVKEAFRKEFGEKRHVYMARIANNRKLARGVNAATDLSKHQSRTVESLDYQSRALVRRFNSRLADFLRQHHRNLLGSVTNPAQMKNLVREMHGQPTGDASAAALAEGIREALEDMRLMFNAAGGTIGKLDNWGLPHSHSRRAIVKAGFERWYGDVEGLLKWDQIEDHLTGKPFQQEGGPPPSDRVKREFLREIFDNITYGKNSREAVYGRPQGSALYKRRAEHRYLHFVDADAWIDYNQRYGTGDPFKSLMGHVHKMARDIVSMREFGPNPGMGVEYQQQLAMERARKEGMDGDRVSGDGNLAQRMFRVQSGGGAPESLWQEYVSVFMSSTRHILTSAFLDRAIVASVSDLNTMRMAAQAIGMNPVNVLSRHVELMKTELTGADALRAHWIAETLADPGIALARFQSEVPPAEIAERLSSASMRIQGLSGWTDAGRMAFQWEMQGVMASFSGRPLAEVDHPIGKLLRDAKVTEREWADLTDPANMFTAGNGATFVDPLWWRETTSMKPELADELFFKIQGMIEEQTEYAVPTQNLMARGRFDAAAYDAPPGTLVYEVWKSGLMFKSFTMTFMVGQYRRIAEQPTIAGKIGYAANMVAGATAMGAIALQLGELIKGNDPMPMDDPMFMAKAALKGGGLAIMGDIIAAGQTNWGGGFASYISGPMPQLAQDAWNLTIKNAYQFATGEDTNFGKELGTAVKRYAPMGQTPLIGPAFDRLVADQMVRLLDPDAEKDFKKKATLQQNSTGNGSFWMPGSPLPHRGPNLSGIFGGS